MLSASFVPTIVRMPVRALDLFGRPSAIRRFVVPIDVDAIEGLALRSLSHVGQEVEETTTSARIPAVADCYPSSAVVLVRGITGVAASPDHRNPTLVSRGFGHAMRFDSCDISLLSPLRSDALLGLLRVEMAAGTPVVAADVATRDSMVNRCLLAASTLTKTWFDSLAGSVAANVRGRLVTPVLAVRKLLATPARTERRWRMSTEKEGGAISEEVLGRDLVPATAFAIHGIHCNRVSAWRIA